MGCLSNAGLFASITFAGTHSQLCQTVAQSLEIRELEWVQLIIFNILNNNINSLVTFPTLFLSAACLPTVTMDSGDTVKKKPCTIGTNNKIVFYK